MIRDGRDVIPSHCDRWGWPAALKAISKWPRYVARARTAEARLPAGRYHEVRYERLVADPRGTLRELLEFLGEPGNPVVLAHDEHPHDVPERYVTSAWSRWGRQRRASAICRFRVGAGRRERLLRLLVTLLAGRTL